MVDLQARPHQVAIVGSGPTGLTLANLLGLAGVDVVLIERNPTTVREPRAVSIDDESLRTMQALGLVDEVLSQVVPGYGSHYFSPRRIRFAIVEPTGTPYGYPRRNAFRQVVLEDQLRRGLARFPNVTTLYGWSSERFVQTSDGVSLDIVDVSGGQAPRTVRCDYLVGCDGASSGIREQLGIVLSGSSFSERWLIVDLENNDNMKRHTDVYCDRRRPCITLPGPHRTRRFEFKLHADERDEDMLAPDSVARLLASHGADPRATIIRKVVYRFHARVAPRWSEGRVFLAGDAAHLTPPFAGQGMNSGVRDAHNLAWKLAAVARGQAGPGLLDTYERERSGHVWQMIELALRMGGIMAPSSWLKGFLTQCGFLALNVWPPARDYVVQMKYKPKPRFSAGFMVPDGRPSRQTLVGRLFPQPRVDAERGEPVLLDELLGNRFALLVRTGDPVGIFARLDHPLWRRLDIGRVALLPAGAPRVEAEGIAVAAEIDGAVAASFAGYEECALLLRPDHYVAAAIPLAAPDAAIADIAALLAGTWPAGHAQRHVEQSLAAAQ